MQTKVLGITALALAASSNAATIRVDVGQDGFSYTPDTIKANVGDTLDFHFHPLNHSVVMGDFSNPCAPAKTGGFFSGFMPVSSGEGPNTFELVVNSTDPIFFYCAQNVLSHCKSGMSGVINPSSSQTLNAYKSAAKSVSSASNPANVFGGKVVASGSTSAAASPSPTKSAGGGGGGGAYGGGGGGGSGGAAADVRAEMGVVAAFAVGMAVFLAG